MKNMHGSKGAWTPGELKALWKLLSKTRGGPRGQSWAREQMAKAKSAGPKLRKSIREEYLMGCDGNP